jgi:hypothetical protein
MGFDGSVDRPFQPRVTATCIRPFLLGLVAPSPIDRG